MRKYDRILMPECTKEGKDQYGFTIFTEPTKPKEFRHYFIEGQHYGSYPAQAIQYQGAFFKPRGLFFFCNECGRIWAECPVDNQRSQLVQTVCERHGQTYSWDYPGSLWLSWDASWIAGLPRKVLIRELAIAEKIQKVGIPQELIDKL